MFDQQCLSSVFTPWKCIVFSAFAFQLNMNQDQTKLYMTERMQERAETERVTETDE